MFDINDIPCIQVTPNEAILFDEGGGSRNKFRRYVFDHVFDDSKSQEVVYQKTTAALVKDVLNGFSAAVFAYGATGSGMYNVGCSFMNEKLLILNCTYIIHLHHMLLCAMGFFFQQESK